jgi:predicted permease
MIENLVLALGGAALGTALALSGRGFLRGILPPTSIPIALNGTVDGRVLVFVGIVTSAAVLLFGLAPALRTTRVDLAETLKYGGRGGSAASGRTRSALVVAQFALSLTALVCGAVFLRRSTEIRDLDRGFRDPERVLLVQTAMEFAGVSNVNAWERSIEAMVDRLKTLPGVQAASVAEYIPLGFIGPDREDIDVPGYAPNKGESMQLIVNAVAPDYFDVMGIDILSGRPIGEQDRHDGAGVTVVNQTFARTYFPVGTAIGRSITIAGKTLTIIGVARDGKYEFRHVDEPSPPVIYPALRQRPAGWVTFHIRSRVEPTQLYGPVRDAIRAVEPRIALVAPTTLAEYASAPTFPTKLGVAVLGVLGTVALILAAMGLYSVIAYTVALRTHEIGIRLALGGTTGHIRLIFLRESLQLLAWGVAVGTVIALGATALLHAKVGFLRLPSLGAILAPALMLAVVAIVAGFVPVRASGRVNLARVLRGD